MAGVLYLVLENGQTFKGKGFGASSEVVGEVVFNTSMVGCIETLTDKSYFGQIVVETFPQGGNYGIIEADFESDNVWASAYIVKEVCDLPSNFRCEKSLDSFLKEKGVTGLCGIDTRALTKALRTEGAMNGIITDDPQSVDFEKLKSYKVKKAVESVSCKEAYTAGGADAKTKVALIDFGVKNGTIKELTNRGCNVCVLPFDADLDAVKKSGAKGIILSEGPGDPAKNTQAVKNIKEFIDSGLPILGLGLGHQMLALAGGAKIEKMKFGNRGANQSVKDLQTGRAHITSQNHGYAVSIKSLKASDIKETFTNINDGTNEGIEFVDKPVFSVQFAPALSTAFIYDKFLKYTEGK